MEDYSHGFNGNNASATISKKISSANAFAPQAVYEDVFGGPPKFGVPTFSSRIEDYTEIFGTFRSSSRRSSIPFLDLPVPEPGDVSVDFGAFKFDYSEIFDDLNGVDFFDSHEELFCDSKGRESSSSEEAWTPDGRGSPSDGSSVDTLACSENNQLMSDGVAGHKFDGAKGFDVSNHGRVQVCGEDGTNGTTHTGQHQAAVDGSILPQKAEVAGTSPQGFSDVNGNSNGGTREEKCFKKTMSLPPMYNSITRSSGNDFRPSNHNTVQRSEEDGTNVTSHTGQHQTVPVVRFVADGSTLPQKTEVVNTLPREVSDISGSMDSSGGTEKNFKKTMSLPPNYNSLSKSSGKDFKLQSRAHGNGSDSGNIFLTVSELSLQTQPSQMPPPKRQPPKLSIKQRNSKIGSEKYDLEGATGDSSNFFDVDVDASSSAAASAAAIKEAMEKAQARINSAKESMERKKDGFQSRTKLGLKDDLSSRAKKEDIKATHEAFRSRGVVPRETSEKEHVGMKDFGGKEGQHDSRTAQVATDFEGKENRLNVGKELFEPNVLKDPISAEESHIHKEAVEWKVEKQFYELAKTGKLSVALEVPEKFEVGEKSISPPTTQKDEESEDVSTKSVSEVGEENVGISNALRGACEQENIRKLDATKEAHELKKGEKKLKVARESIGREENDKKLKLAQETSKQEEDEKKLQVPSALEGHGKQLEEDHGQKENEKKLEEACESEEFEKRPREASWRKVNEGRLKETDEQEESGKKLTESCNIEENEKRLKDSSEQEESEKKLVGACDGRRLQEVHEKGENDKWQEEVLEGEESEKQLEEAHEKEGNGKNIQEAHECEESEKRLKKDFEWEENERRLKEACKLKESENIKEDEKKQKVFELEEGEKSLKEVHKLKESENRLKESCEMDANETQLEVVFELVENHGERLGNEEEKYENREKGACKGEENENKAKVDQEALDLKTDKSLMMAGMPCEPVSSNNCEASQEGLEHEENIGKLEVAPEAIEHEGSGKMPEAAKDVCESERSKKELIIASARKRDDVNGRSKPANVPQYDPEQDKCEHIEVSMKSLSLDEPDNRLGEPDTTNYLEQNEKPNRTLPVACDQESLGKSQVSFDQESFKEKNEAAEGIKIWVENEKQTGFAHSVISAEAKGNMWKVAQQAGKSQNREREERNDETCNNVEREKEVRLQREREVEEERLRKIEEEKEREREREKDRMAVERATREARERAFIEARERAERAAVERATNEVRQRAMAEAREKLEKASAEAREKSLAEKAIMEARLRAERAAVERATAEARERAAEKAALEARRQAERSLPDRFATTNSKDSGMKRSSSLYEFRETQVKGSGYNSSLRHTRSSVHASNTSVKFQGTEGESAQRCKARLERHQRTFERAAKALAEKNSRDLLAQKEQAERNRLAETLDAEVRRWSSGKEGNLRALLSTLQYILGPDGGWQPIPLTEVITAVAVKKAYRKATLCVHPDKLQQRGASIQQKYICEKVFDLLKEAWNKFNSEER